MHLHASTCIYVHLNLLICIYMNLNTSTLYMHLHASTCIDMIFQESTWIYVNLHESTCIYMNLHESTSIAMHLHESTSIAMHLHESDHARIYRSFLCGCKNFGRSSRRTSGNSRCKTSAVFACHSGRVSAFFHPVLLKGARCARMPLGPPLLTPYFRKTSKRS